jgi:hypothetical protein
VKPDKAPTEEGSRQYYLELFDMCLLMKSGASPEVMAARAGKPDLGRPARPDDFQPVQDKATVDRVVAENIKRTEAFLRHTVARSLLAHATAMKRMERAAADARQAGSPTDLQRAKLYEAQMKRIFLRLSATWLRMKREIQTPVLREVEMMVLKEAPAEADWLFAIAAVDKIGPQVLQPDGSMNPAPFQVWQPLVFSRRDGALDAEAERLRRAASDATAPRFFSSGVAAAW